MLGRSSPPGCQGRRRRCPQVRRLSGMSRLRETTMIVLLITSLALAGAPNGWTLHGVTGYTAAVSSDAKHGRKSLVLTGTEGARPFGTVMQTISPREVLNQRIRMTVWLRTEDVEDWAGAWLRVDRDDVAVAFDNMQNRALRGTNEWSIYTIVVDVPPDATSLSLGVILSGSGRMWADDVKLEIVDPTEVDSTDMLARRKPRTPTNLDFER